MGIVNYLRKFAPNLATVAAPLSELQGSTKEFAWNHTHTEAFNQIKTIFNSKQILVPIKDDIDPVYLMTDASNTGIAGCVGQKINDVIRPAGFHSGKLNPGQVNYTTTDKELLAIVDSLRHFQDELQGHKITIRTDHQALVSFMKNIQTNQMKRRWQEFMSQFDITLEHIKGENNAIADFLSRANARCSKPIHENFPLGSVEVKIPGITVREHCLL